jgi:FKBP-type peptidyl-prolyl cis-trans isomerase FkpA
MFKLLKINLIIMIKKTEKIRLLLVAALVMVLVTSCDSSKKLEKEQKEQIQNYLSSHPDLDFVLKESGLYYCDVVVGTGIAAATHDTAYVIYTAKYLNDVTLGSNVGGDTLIFPIGEGALISGFDEGITYMKEGGEAILLFPSELGYGNSGYYFSAWTPLVFEVYLPKIEPSTAK